jgi:hypothetical protein
MVPIAAFLLWQHPRLRWPALAIVAVHSAAVIATGYADDWITALVTVGTDQIGTLLNLSPSRFLGIWWLLVGIPLAVVLVTRHKPGLAALAISPYVLPHYLLLGLLDLPTRRRARP